MAKPYIVKAQMDVEHKNKTREAIHNANKKKLDELIEKAQDSASLPDRVDVIVGRGLDRAKQSQKSIDSTRYLFNNYDVKPASAWICSAIQRYQHRFLHLFLEYGGSLNDGPSAPDDPGGAVVFPNQTNQFAWVDKRYQKTAAVVLYHAASGTINGADREVIKRFQAMSEDRLKDLKFRLRQHNDITYQSQVVDKERLIAALV